MEVLRLLLFIWISLPAFNCSPVVRTVIVIHPRSESPYLDGLFDNETAQSWIRHPIFRFGAEYLWSYLRSFDPEIASTAVETANALSGRRRRVEGTTPAGDETLKEKDLPDENMENNLVRRRKAEEEVELPKDPEASVTSLVVFGIEKARQMYMKYVHEEYIHPFCLSTCMAFLPQETCEVDCQYGKTVTRRL